jgi:hypothetical protein
MKTLPRGKWMMNCTLSASLSFTAVTVCMPARAETVLFDFDNAPIHASLPIDVTVGGITAALSATGQGFSVQEANVLGFTPVGFSGRVLYPNSINAADLLIGFTQPLSQFSILYAPEEYATDSSARMRVTAYLGDAFVGTSTKTAEPGTWPSATLAIGPIQNFDRVVIHYDASPPTGGDYGPIFMADNMNVTPVPEPASYTMVSVGLGLVSLAARRQRRKLARQDK